MPGHNSARISFYFVFLCSFNKLLLSGSVTENEHCFLLYQRQLARMRMNKTAIHFFTLFTSFQRLHGFKPLRLANDRIDMVSGVGRPGFFCTFALPKI